MAREPKRSPAAREGTDLIRQSAQFSLTFNNNSFFCRIIRSSLSILQIEYFKYQRKSQSLNRKTTNPPKFGGKNAAQRLLENQKTVFLYKKFLKKSLLKLLWCLTIIKRWSCRLFIFYRQIKFLLWTSSFYVFAD